MSIRPASSVPHAVEHGAQDMSGKLFIINSRYTCVAFCFEAKALSTYLCLIDYLSKASTCSSV